MVRKKGDLDRMDTDLLKHGCRLNRNTKLPPGMREQKCSSGDVRYHVVGNDNTRDTVYMFMSEDGTVGLDFCKPSKDPIQREAHEMLMFFGAMGIVQGTATSLLQLCKNLGVKQPEGHVIWIELSRLVLLNRCMFMWSMDMEDVLVTEERKNRSLVSEGGNNEIRRAVDKYFGILTRPVLFANDRRMRCVEDLTETNGTVNMRLEVRHVAHRTTLVQTILGSRSKHF